MTLGRVVAQVYGRVAPALESLVTRDLDESVDSLILDAVERWRTDNWRRFDDREVNCTVQLYRCALEAKRARRGFAALRVTLEFTQVTRAIFEGTESVSHAARPDMRIGVGESAGRSIECKRLTDSDDWARKYVKEGMARFLSGHYPPDVGSGRMVGYIQSGDPAAVVSRVNRVVLGDPDLGNGHELQPLASRVGFHRYRSSHSANGFHQGVVLDHFHLDMN